MDTKQIIIIIIIIYILSLILGICIYKRFVKKTINSLEKMLDEAIQGTFEENYYDETILSKLENKLYRFLSVSSLSRNHIEKDHLKIKQLISDISHQTKTPLSNICIYTQLLMERKLDEESRSMVQNIHEQSDKLDFLIVNLVKMSRLENEIIQIHPSLENMTYLINEIVKTYEPIAAKKKILLQAENNQDIKACYDSKWTLEAVGNIVDNAIKYTPEGGKITIKTKKFNLFSCIEITDTGIGIEEEEQAKIFGRFYRSKEVIKENGIGIGLYLARQIITQQNGYIKVSSSPGKGSTFSIYFKIPFDSLTS